MAWTQADLDAIEAAIAQGERTVEYQDRRVTYRTIQELLDARAQIQRVVIAASASPKKRQTRVETRKGYR